METKETNVEMTSQGEDTGSTHDMGVLLDSIEPIKPLRRGDVVEGIVMRADSDGIFVNIGHKAEGVVPPGEMRTLTPDDMENLKVGDQILTLVVRAETAEQAAILSIDRAIGEQGWRYLEKVMEAEDSIEGTIMGFNRGGAIVEVEGVQGFVPMSQLVSVSRALFREAQEPRQDTEGEKEGGEKEGGEKEGGEKEGGEKEGGEKEGGEKEGGEGEVASPQPDPRAGDIGKVLQLKVLEVNRGRNRAIFSERQAIQAWRDEQKAKLIQELTEGETRRGRVTGISSFGAFVDLGGADGLIHISELSWNPVNSPEEIVQIGDELDVYVLRVDAENKKIALSLRRLQPEPWDSINDRYEPGDIVDAKVTKLTNFGAFARVEGSEGSVEGLIHISELTSRMINHPREVVHEGDDVKVKILRIEPERRRLGLSLKQAEEEEDQMVEEEEVAEEEAEEAVVAGADEQEQEEPEEQEEAEEAVAAEEDEQEQEEPEEQDEAAEEAVAAEEDEQEPEEQEEAAEEAVAAEEDEQEPEEQEEAAEEAVAAEEDEQEQEEPEEQAEAAEEAIAAEEDGQQQEEPEEQVGEAEEAVAAEEDEQEQEEPEEQAEAAEEAIAAEEDGQQQEEPEEQVGEAEEAVAAEEEEQEQEEPEEQEEAAEEAVAAEEQEQEKSEEQEEAAEQKES